MAQAQVPQECRVVVVEDHPETAGSLERLFRLHKVDVRIARNGGSGLAAVREHRPQIVFSALQLPDMTGFELAARIRREFAAAPVLIAIDAVDAPGNAAAALRAGFAAHFTRPVNPMALLSLARSAALASAPREAR